MRSQLVSYSTIAAARGWWKDVGGTMVERWMERWMGGIGGTMQVVGVFAKQFTSSVSLVPRSCIQIVLSEKKLKLAVRCEI